MRVLCLQLPHLGLRLAIQQRLALAGRPVVLIAGHGDDAVVADRSCEAAARGVLVGLSAGQARGTCAGAVFLADNAGACLDELERLATILRLRATTRVAIGGRDHLFIDMSGAADEARAAARLGGLMAAWSGCDVRAGVASTRADALDAARAARRAPVIVAPGGDEDEPGIGPFREDSLTGEWNLDCAQGGLQARARTVRLLARLDAVLAAQGRSFRSASVTVRRLELVTQISFAMVPAHAASDLLPELAGRLGADGLAGATGLEVRLERLGPDVRVRRLPRERNGSAPRPSGAPILQRAS